MLKTVTEKIPVRIDWTKNSSGEYDVQIVMNSSDFFGTGTSIRSKIQRFKNKYLVLIEDSKKLAKTKNKKDRKFTSKHWWRLGKLLNDFNQEIDGQFVISNYTEAISRDLQGFEMSDTEVSVACQFANYFKRDEISEKISIAHYREFCWKTNQLIDLNILEKEKENLLKMSENETLGNHKKYREYLKEKISNGGRK